jgi:hypothetical protein
MNCCKKARAVILSLTFFSFDINIRLIFAISFVCHHLKMGGEMASTGVQKLRLHTDGSCQSLNGRKLNIIADDYNYAMAA